VLDVTVTLTVHVAPAARFPPVNATLFPPAVAEAVPLPHVVEAFGVPAIVTFAGSVSVKARFVSAAAPDAVLAIVSSSTDVPPTRICAGVNVLLNATAGATFTVSVSVAGAPLVAP
jgi:hypothetical protein